MRRCSKFSDLSGTSLLEAVALVLIFGLDVVIDGAKGGGETGGPPVIGLDDG